MIVAIQPPRLLPWLGYLDRMARADLFVVLDHARFEAGGPERAHYLDAGVPRALEAPLVARGAHERIVDKALDHAGHPGWGASAFAAMRDAYRDAPYFGLYAAPLEGLLCARWTRFADLALASIELLREAFGLLTPMIRSSELALPASASTLEICRAVGAGTLLGGSRAGLDAKAFERAGIQIAWPQFRHPVYAQPGRGAFVRGLSAIDALFSCGPLAAQLLLASAFEEAL